MRYEKEGIFVTGVHEIDKIPDPSARLATRYVFEQLHPGEEVIVGYETEFYELNTGNKKIGTRPDVNVYLPDDSQYVRECTKSKKKWCVQSLQSLPLWLGKTDVVFSESGGIELPTVLVQWDPKSKQKRVMQAVAPHLDYDVWYAEDLLEIEKMCYHRQDQQPSEFSSK